jgi:ribose transport system substrate-binding protein
MTKESDYDRPRSGKRLVTRRQFAALTGGAALLTTGLGQRSALAAPVQKLVLSIRDFGQQNSRLIKAGAQQFADSMKLPLQVLVYNNDPNLEMSGIKAALSEPGTVVSINSWPNTGESTGRMASLAQHVGAFLVTQWNKPDDLHPWDFGENYVSHITFDARAAAKELCTGMFKAMGGKGGFCAIQGLLDTTNAQQAFKGVQDALAAFPDVKMLDQQAGDWDRTKALNITRTWASQHGDKLSAVWAANDDMALGALEALRSAGLNKKVLVTGADGVPDAVQAVKNGEFYATMLFDSYWQGGIGLALTYAAATGKLVPSKEPKSHREFYGPLTLVTADNADQWLKPRDPKNYDFSDLFGKTSGQITY